MCLIHEGSIVSYLFSHVNVKSLVLVVVLESATRSLKQLNHPSHYNICVYPRSFAVEKMMLMIQNKHDQRRINRRYTQMHADTLRVGVFNQLQRTKGAARISICNSVV